MKKTSIIKIGLSIVMVGVIAVGATLAWLSWTAPNPTANVFNVAGGGYKSTFNEPNFNPTVAKSMAPGISVPKDPQIQNTSTVTATDPGTDQWVGMTVTFVYGPSAATPGAPLSAADLQTLLNVIAISWGSQTPAMNNELAGQQDGQTKTTITAPAGGTRGFNLGTGATTTWTAGATSSITTALTPTGTGASGKGTAGQDWAGTTGYANQMIFYYNVDLLPDSVPGTAGQYTTPLFNAVNVNPNADLLDLQAIAAWGGYNIVLNSASVQSEADGAATHTTINAAVQKELNKLLLTNGTATGGDATLPSQHTGNPAPQPALTPGVAPITPVVTP